MDKMCEYLVLKLDGPMQAWGKHTYEDFRPTENFPTRSGLIGLLGACIGIERTNIESRENLNKAVSLCVVAENPEKIRKIEDFHTIKNARKSDGKDPPRKDPIVSKREYLCDAKFDVLISFNDDSIYSMDSIEQALNKPYYTPCLGRKSCPITRPLIECRIKAHSLLDAINKICLPVSRIIYSEIPLKGASKYMVRDVPVKSNIRKFSKRQIYILAQEAKKGE